MDAHKHQCPDCNVIWEHGRSASIADHQCPMCGAIVTLIYEPVEAMEPEYVI